MTTTGNSDHSSGVEAIAIEVSQSVLEAIAAHARDEAPLECCGILIGRERRIERAARARNALASATRYLVDADDHFAALKSARESGQSVVGFYHSHPASPPAPSETDRAEAAYPGHWHLIVFPGSAAQAAEIRAYRLVDSGNFLPVEIVRIP